jgi:hypothetical protein
VVSQGFRATVKTVVQAGDTDVNTTVAEIYSGEIRYISGLFFLGLEQTDRLVLNQASINVEKLIFRSLWRTGANSRWNGLLQRKVYVDPCGCDGISCSELTTESRYVPSVYGCAYYYVLLWQLEQLESEDDI